MQVPENIRRRPSRQERWEIVQTLLERKDLINNARAAFRQAYPNAPEEMLQTAIFHTYVDGIGAAIDWLTDLELFLREPNDGLDIGNTSHLLYHLYNWFQFNALLPESKEGVLERLKDIKDLVSDGDLETILLSIEELESIFKGGRSYPDFR
jgi:hypothetical protein